MWYLLCLAVIIAFLSICSIVGLAICRLLPYRVRPYAAFGFSPLFGLAFFVLLSTLVGWIGAFSSWLCLPITLAVAGASAYQVRSAGKIFRCTTLVAIVGAVTSLGFLFCVIRFGAYDPFNDTFTYLVHAQWLQEHSFRQPAIVSGNQPAFTQVLLYQHLHARMGASFLFGWVQAVFGLQWSYLVYPSVVLLPLAGGALALSGSCAFAIRRSRGLSLLAGPALATTVNGFSFGTVAGFLPQTYGLAFAFGGLTLLAIVVFGAHGAGRVRWTALMPVGLLFAALVFCYPEIVPFIAIAAALFAIFALAIRPDLRSRILHMFVGTLAILVVLVNLEAFRMVRSVLVQMSAVVGGPVTWNPIQFLSHSMGLLSGVWDGSVFVLGSAAATGAVAIAASVLTIAAIWARRRQIRLAPIGASLCMIAVAVAAFVYFRYFASSPWPTGVGASWSQFKLSNWVSPFVIFIASSGAISIGRCCRWCKVAVIAVLIGWQTVGLAANYWLADSRTRSIRQEMGSDRAPFEAYRDLRWAIARQANGFPVFLDLGGAHHKNRQMVCYFLWGLKVASDWSDDGYMFPSLPPVQRSLPIEPGMLVVAAAHGSARSREERVGSLSIYRAGERRVMLLNVSGGYDEEADGNSVWRWTPGELRYCFKVVGRRPARLRAGFTYLGATAGRQVRISLVQGGKVQHLETLVLAGGWNKHILPEFEAMEPEFQLVLRCDEPAVRLGTSDPRVMSFLIKDLELQSAGVAAGASD